jgi:O-antigen ligase
MASILHEQGRMVSAARWQPAQQYLQAGDDSPSREVRAPGWDLLLACVAVYVATAVGRIHELFPVLLPLKPALVAAVLAIALYLLQAVGRRGMGLLRTRTTTWLLFLVLWVALSVPGALNHGVAFRSWTEFVRTTLMALIVAGSVRSGRDIERLILVYFAVTTVYVTVVLSRFQLGADNWRLGRLYYYDANDLATLITTAMPLGLYFVLGQRGPVRRALAGVGLAILALGLIRSGSRGGFLAFLAVTAFVLLRVTTIPARSRWIGLAVIVSIVFGAASDQYWSQMQTMVHPHQDYNLTSDEGRVRIWKRGLGYMADNPVFGVGAHNFQVAEGTISPMARRQERGIGVRWGAAHNTYVQAGAEIGIPGLLLFLGLIASTFAALRRVARRTPQADPAGHQRARLAQSLMAALVGFVVGAFFLSLVYHDMLYVLVAFAVGLAKVARVDAARWSAPVV